MTTFSTFDTLAGYSEAFSGAGPGPEDQNFGLPLKEVTYDDLDDPLSLDLDYDALYSGVIFLNTSGQTITITGINHVPSGKPFTLLNSASSTYTLTLNDSGFPFNGNLAPGSVVTFVETGDDGAGTFYAVDNGNLHLKKGATEAATGTFTLDPNAADVFTITPSGDCTINGTLLSGATKAKRITLIVTTTGTSSRTLTFGTNFKTTDTLATGTSDAKVFVMSFVATSAHIAETGRTAAM